MTVNCKAKLLNWFAENHRTMIPNSRNTGDLKFTFRDFVFT